MEETDPEIIKINQQILELRRKRDKLLSEEISQRDEKIRDLKWTKDCDAELKINPLIFDKINPRYTITLSGKTPLTHMYVVVMGASKLDRNNIIYSNDAAAGCYCLSTYNKDLLVKFLSAVKFKSFSFDEATLEVLLACRNLKNRMEYPHMTGGQG